MGTHRTTRSLLLFVLGVLIFVFLIVFKFDLSSFASIVSDKISLGFYIFIFLFITLQLAFRAVRFNLLFNYVFEEKISLRDSLLLTGASFFVALVTPNKLGDTARGFFHGEKGLEITAIAIIEYFFDTFILVGIAILGLLTVYQQHLSRFVLAVIIAVAGLAVLFGLVKYGRIETFVGKFSWYRKISDKMRLLKSHLRTGIKSKFVLSVGFVFSCFLPLIYFLIFYMVLRQLGADVSVLGVFFPVGVGLFIGALTFIPMGIGTRDLSICGLLCAVGVNEGIAISSVVIMRSLSVSLMVASGICYFLAINRFAGKK